MKIPKRFKLHGRTINVKIVDTLIDERNWHGVANFRMNEIRLQSQSDNHPFPKDLLEAIFCHELIHWILFIDGTFGPDGELLYKDESIVDRLGGLIHQAFTTMEYK